MTQAGRCRRRSRNGPNSFAGSSEKTKPAVKTSASVPAATLKPMTAPAWDAATRAHYGVEGVRGSVVWWGGGVEVTHTHIHT